MTTQTPIFVRFVGVTVHLDDGDTINEGEITHSGTSVQDAWNALTEAIYRDYAANAPRLDIREVAYDDWHSA